MGYDWEKHKEEIIFLYRHVRHGLEKVRDIILAKDPEFKACISSYRQQLRKWGAYKFPHNRVDDAVSETRQHAATPFDGSEQPLERRRRQPHHPGDISRTPTDVTTPNLPNSLGMQHELSCQMNARDDVGAGQSQPRRSTDATHIAEQLTAENDLHLLTDATLYLPFVGTSLLGTDGVLHPHEHRLSPVLTIQDPSTPIRVPHARKDILSETTPPHFESQDPSPSTLRSSPRLPTPTPGDRIFSDNRQSDIQPTAGATDKGALETSPMDLERPFDLENTVLVGPPDRASLPDVLLRAVEEKTHARNDVGETFLHLLDPAAVGDSLPELLMACSRLGFNFNQRSSSGLTAIHAIFSKVIDLCIICRLMPLLPLLHVNVHARDRWGRSLFDFFLSLESARGQEPVLIGTVLKTFAQLRREYTRPQDEELTATPLGSSHPVHGQAYGDGLNELQRVPNIDAAMSEIVLASFNNPQVEDAEGWTALFCLVHMLHYAPGLFEPLVYLSPYHRQELMQACVGSGVDVSAYDKHGSTVSHYLLSRAWIHNDEECTASILQMLLEAGVDVHLRDCQGDTILHLACKYGLRQCTRVIIDHVHRGSNPDLLALCVSACNDSGRSVVSEAHFCLSALQPTGDLSAIQDCINQVVAAGGIERFPCI